MAGVELTDMVAAGQGRETIMVCQVKCSSGHHEVLVFVSVF